VEATRAEFNRWHDRSFAVHLLTLALATVAMLMAGAMPRDAGPPKAGDEHPARAEVAAAAPAPPVNAPS
jgi:hypothetical protein